MEEIRTLYYELNLLTNLDNVPEGGGALVIDRYTFDPGLKKGDEIEVRDWTVGVRTGTRIFNKSFSFSARVMSIKKIVLCHKAFVIRIFLESPNRETINAICEALDENQRNFN